MERGPVIVVGGGVIGLTTAIRLAKNHRVTVISEKLGADTNSALATAVWHVFLVKVDMGTQPPSEIHLEQGDRHLDWAAQTLNKLVEWSAIPGSGVEMIEGVELIRRPLPTEFPAWVHNARSPPISLKFLTPDEVNDFNRHDQDQVGPELAAALRTREVQYGYRLTVPAADMPQHLRWLVEQAAKAGVSFETERFSSLEQAVSKLKGRRPLAIVNCTGLEASQFASDGGFCAFRGEYFVVPADEKTPKCYIGDDDHPEGMAYAIPRLGKVIAGGKAIPERDAINTPVLTWEETRDRASLYFPWLRNPSAKPESLDAVICLRPVRIDGVRLTLEISDDTLPIVHNYGHGGSGWSMCWGCAGEVARLVGTLQPTNTNLGSVQ
jgi:D-amino-acid oxidase